MAKVSDFERYVLPFVDGAPLPAIDDAVVDASVEFCTRTRVLRQFLDPLTLLAGIGEYELDSPSSQTVITSVTGAWLPQGEIKSKTRPELDAQYPDGWALLSTDDVGEVWGFHCRLPGFIRLVPMLSVKAAQALILEVAYAPTRTATELDDVLFDRYAEVIAAGALSRLHQHPGAKYADPTRVATYTQEFELAVTDCADDSAHGFAHQPLSTAPDDIV